MIHRLYPLLLFVVGCAAGRAMPAASTCPEAPAARATKAAQETGLIETASVFSHKETVDRLVTAIEAMGFRVFTVIDHAANATSAGLELAPTTVVVFGNPKVGSLLMQSSTTVAIDLPQKFLVWQDASGRVKTAYNDPRYLARRHGLVGEDKLVAKIAVVLAGLAKAATRATE